MASEARQAGPALDALVAERVMGLEVAWFYSVVDLIPVQGINAYLLRNGRDPRPAGSTCALPFYRDQHVAGRWWRVAGYSHAGGPMLLVIERMRALGWDFAVKVTRTPGYRVWFDKMPKVTDADFRYGDGRADTLPHAVALAAPAALEGQDG